MTRHRFRPRYTGVAGTSIGIGGALFAVTLAAGPTLGVVFGAMSVVGGIAYLLSPTWRMAIVVDDAGLRVVTARKTKLALAWGDVVKVIAAPAHHTCFVDGGSPANSVLVPGEGAPAPYDLEDRAALYAAILARVPADRVELVDSLEDVRKREKRD